jgi:hypothetical protein
MNILMKNSIGNNCSLKNLQLKKRSFTKTNLQLAFNEVSSIQIHQKWEMQQLKLNKDNLRVA